MLLLGLTCAVPPASADQPARVIVKYRGESSLLTSTPEKRARTLAARTQAEIVTQRELRPRVQLMQANGLTSTELARRLTAQPDVEYAVPDRIKQIRAVPNDPLFTIQWHLQAAQPSAIDAQAAWDISQGSATTIVAVVDTGIRPDHPDLAAKIVPGYDFVSNVAAANDGNARDADPSDPGDWVSTTDIQNTPFLEKNCRARVNAPTDSSWHGTQVAGVVAAATNNSAGGGGVGWNARIEPIRALGKCGGYDSDIIDGMRWAAGLPVTGVGPNPNPARIINLSLGGVGSCSAAYVDAIGEITAKGVLVVVAAGNESGAVDEPANCPGVLAVAGLRHNGAKVGYSSFGPEIGIAAPAGNCGNNSPPCLFPIITTTNSGTTIPLVSTYTDPTKYSVGTSFASPQVAGVAALMLGAHPELSPAQLIQRIKNGATAFPTDPTEQACPIVDSAGMCNCTTMTCGAGMLNAAGAMQDALRPEALITMPANVVAGQAFQLDASASSSAVGHTIASHAWHITNDGGTASSLSDADRPTASVITGTAGSVVISLTVTDDAGLSDTTSQTIKITAPSAMPPTPALSHGGGGGAVDPLDITLLAMLSVLGYAVRRERDKR